MLHSIDIQPDAMVPVMTDKERQDVKRLRAMTLKEISAFPAYDTDFNLLRFIQQCDSGDLNETAVSLKNHLKWRRFFNLDQPETLIVDPVARDYFPLGLVGEWRG